MSSPALEGVHRLVFWKHKKHKTYVSSQLIPEKYSTPCVHRHKIAKTYLVLHIPFTPRYNKADYKKGAHQLPTLKKNITMVEPFAWSSGMAMVLIANRSRQPLCNGLVEGSDEGFSFIFVNWSRNKLISKHIDHSLVFYTTSQLDCPKTIKSRSPRTPRWSHLMSHLFPVKPACFWLVVAFLFVFGGCLRPCCIFVPDFFRCLICDNVAGLLSEFV
jgi:hypothetical protein